ncbi:hypothetical protein [Salegentibacter sp. Hel_I_6]
MKELIGKISTALEAFKADSELHSKKGNQAVGTMARKA